MAHDRVLGNASFDTLPHPIDQPAGVARLRLNSALEVALDDGRVIATFINSLLIDNFEGLAARPTPDGGTMLYMISEDNFSGHQRTLLYQLHLAPI